MKLLSIHLQRFRKHESLQLSLEGGANILYGHNGAGKTNVLEAIYFVCLTKSFLGASDADCLRFDAADFEIDAEMQSDAGVQSSVRVYYSASEGKHIFINRSPLDQFSKIVGEYPCVAMSPQDIGLVQGSPQERRKFLDGAISQTNKAYLEDLFNYKRALTQRNKLLAELRLSPRAASELRASLEVWTEQFSLIAASLIARRIRFAEEFATHLKDAYARFSSFEEAPSIDYESDFSLEQGLTKEDILKRFEHKLRSVESEEQRRGQTLLGPHRDDIKFTVDGHSLKKFASQGQQKTFVICLKLAQQFYIRERLGETPIFLLDDVFSELDRDRAKDLISLLKPLGQSVITTTGRKDFDGVNQLNIEALL